MVYFAAEILRTGGAQRGQRGVVRAGPGAFAPTGAAAARRSSERNLQRRHVAHGDIVLVVALDQLARRRLVCWDQPELPRLDVIDVFAPLGGNAPVRQFSCCFLLD